MSPIPWVLMRNDAYKDHLPGTGRAGALPGLGIILPYPKKVGMYFLSPNVFLNYVPAQKKFEPYHKCLNLLALRNLER